MKYWKYAGLCAAGFLLEAAIGAALVCLVFFMLVFCLLIAVPACILIGKAHVFFSRKIRNEFGICPVIYYITAMGLPVLMWVGGAVVGLAFPELLTFGTVNSLSEGYAGFARLIVILGAALNSILAAGSGAHFIHKEHVT